VSIRTKAGPGLPLVDSCFILTYMAMLQWNILEARRRAGRTTIVFGALAILVAALIAPGCSKEPGRISDEAEGHYEAGVGFLNHRLYDKAIAEFTEAIEADRGYAEAYCDRGVSHYMKGEVRAALQDFDTAVEKDPALGKAHFHRAMILEQDGKRQEAIRAYEDFIRHSEHSPDIYVERANRRIRELKAPPE
jgi:tetratricopeptide (TPR) repeat protein